MKPDFLCIGAQKAGTGFLYDCLQTVDAFRLPPRKELHHFDRGDQPFYGNVLFLRRVARTLGFDRLDDDAALRRQFRRLWRPWPWQPQQLPFDRPIALDWPNIRFLRRYADYVLGEASDEQYLGLFQPYARWVTGDMTPAYSVLDEDQVRAVDRLLPGGRYILSVREPVGRLWSQVNMNQRNRFRKLHERVPDEDDREELESYLDDGRLEEMLAGEAFVGRSFLTRTWRTWEAVVGKRLLVVHFDDLVRRTEAVLDRICAFLDADPARSQPLPQNRKAGAVKLAMSPAHRAALEAFLGPEIEAFHAAFEDHPDRVAAPPATRD